MPLPPEKVCLYVTRACNILQEYTKEVEVMQLAGNHKRVESLFKEIKLVSLIVKAMVKPYVPWLRGSMTEEQLRLLGLLED